MPTRGSEPWIPCGLCVVVGVDVDPTWSEEKTVCVDDAMCVSSGGLCCGVDGGDDAVLEGDVCLCFWVAGAVNEACISNDSFLTWCCVAGALIWVRTGHEAMVAPHSWRVSGDAPAVYSVEESFRISAQLIDDVVKMEEK